MNAGHRIFRNFLSLTTATVVTNIIGAVNVAYLGHRLGPSDFGKMNFSLAFIGYFAIFSHLGLNTIGTRDIARNKEDAGKNLNRILTIKVILGTIAYAAMLPFLAASSQPQDIKILILLYGATIFTASVLPLDWVFQGLDKMEYLGISSVISSVAYLLLLVSFIYGPGQLLYVPLALIASHAIVIIFLLFAFKRMYADFRFSFDLSGWKALIKQALPVGLTGVFSIIIMNSGTIMLGTMKNIEDVGYFSAAYKIIQILTVMAVSLNTAVFPTLASQFKHAPEDFNRTFNYILKLTLIAGLPLAAGATVLATSIIGLFYGTKFMNAPLSLQILIWSAFLTFFTTMLSHALWACDRQNAVFKITLIQAALSLLINYALISRFGLYGASAAPVVFTLITVLLYYRSLKATIRMNATKYILKPLLSACFMGAVLYPLRGMNIFLTIPAGILLYSAAMLVMKGVTREDITLIFSYLRLKNANS